MAFLESPRRAAVHAKHPVEQFGSRAVSSADAMEFLAECAGSLDIRSPPSPAVALRGPGRHFRDPRAHFVWKAGQAARPGVRPGAFLRCFSSTYRVGQSRPRELILGRLLPTW